MAKREKGLEPVSKGKNGFSNPHVKNNVKAQEGGKQVSPFAFAFHPATFQEGHFTPGSYVADNRLENATLSSSWLFLQLLNSSHYPVGGAPVHWHSSAV